MKQSFAVLAIIVLAVSALASPEAIPAVTCSGVTTSTTPVTAEGQQRLSGYINALEVRISPSAATCTVTVATAGYGGLTARTIYTGSVGGYAFVRPVVPLTTNAVDIVAHGKEFLTSDAITVSAHTAAYGTNDSVSATVTVVPVIERQP